MIFENNTDKVLDVIGHFSSKKREFILKTLDLHNKDVSQITTYDGHYMIIFKFSKENDSGLSYIMSKEKQELINFIKEEFHKFHSGTKEEKDRLISELIKYNLIMIK